MTDRFALHDTIVAVASPEGAADRAIVRLSGEKTGHALERLGLTEPKPTSRARACIASLALPGWPAVPDVRVLRFFAPRSYTGEHAAELHVLGSQPLLEAILESLTAETGVRLACPGEFTLRAFLNGRLDLAQAESVAALAGAGDLAEARAALTNLLGGLSDRVRPRLARLRELLGLIELSLDFAEEEDALDLTAAHRGIVELEADLTELAGQARTAGATAHVRPIVALAGRPNAGKSAWFNRCLEHAHERGSTTAIQADQPGTTRDALEADLTLAGIDVRLIDAAGVTGLEQRSDAGEPRDPNSLAALAEARARSVWRIADVVVWCIDGSVPLDDREVDLLNDAASTTTNAIVLRTKADLEPASWTEADVRGRLASPLASTPIACSARTGEGVVLFTEAVVSALSAKPTTAGGYHLNARQRSGLDGAQHSLAEATTLMEADDRNPELVAEALREAEQALAATVGEAAITPDELLADIFARFCIGK